tara:strand:- start:3514 stop:6402 length:2889 start_codon:yes stop_codon:yes gene_type:complete
VRSFYDEVRIAYLSARERPKDYGDEWNRIVDSARKHWDSPTDFGDLMRERLDESLVYSDKTKDPSSSKAKSLYEKLKSISSDSDITQDPFRKKYGEKIADELIADEELLAIFLHWAYRNDRKALPDEDWADNAKLVDDFTEGFTGLDLVDKEIYEWLVKNYGEDINIERLKTKIPAARQLLYKVFSKTGSGEEWSELLESKRLMKASNVVKKEMTKVIKGIIKDMVEVEKMHTIRMNDIIGKVKEFIGEYRKEKDKIDAKRQTPSRAKNRDWYKGKEITDDFIRAKVGLIFKHNHLNYVYHKSNRHGSSYVNSNISKAEKDPVFIQPNKPMYRIFEIDDIKELKGFTGEWVVQEKYDGMRIQIHKSNEIKIYSFNGNDITHKFKKQVKLIEDEDFPECILDAEAVLYKADEPLHRADTVAYINSKENRKGYEIKVHIFDIMKHDKEDVFAEKLEERIQRLMNNFSSLSHDRLQFPNKRDTRFADSIGEIEEYAKEIMENPTAEGVMIKDSKSSYIKGKKKNPKWIKWKKFIDLDLMVLDIRKNKNNTYSYTLGAGPISDEDEYKNVKEINDNKYLIVGKALNTSIKIKKVGLIIRVKVDEVKKVDGGFSIYSAKVVEIPEEAEPEKIITLEFLSRESKKSIKEYTIEALKKSYTITDNIHGVSTIHTDLTKEGYVIYGFDNNLMGKNAMTDIDIWKNKMKEMYGKDSGKIMTAVHQFIRNDGDEKPFNIDEIIEHLKIDLKEELYRLIKPKKGDESKEKSLKDKLTNRLKEAGPAFGGILFNEDKEEFYWDGTTLLKDPEEDEVITEPTFNDEAIKIDRKTPDKYEDGKYEIWRRGDGDLNLLLELHNRKLMWRIEQDTTDDLFNLFGKADKFKAEIDSTLDKGKLLDKGVVKLGSQRDGYHEYILTGDLHKGKMHFRIVTMAGNLKWITWTGYEQEPTLESSDEGLWDITQDRHKSTTYSE